MEKQQIQKIVEGALLAYGQPLSVAKLHSLFVTESKETDEGEQLPTKVQIEKSQVLEALETIQESCADNGFELKEVGSGWRFQVREETAPWVNKLWDEKPQRYSRALMETIAIISYRQPITRGDIEEIRGVAVSSNIIKTLTEREWVKVVGQRDVPGRPSLYATTKQFLDYFNLKSLEDLPSLKELTDIESLTPELNLEQVSSNNDASSQEEADLAEEAGELESTSDELKEVASNDLDEHSENETQVGNIAIEELTTDELTSDEDVAHTSGDKEPADNSSNENSTEQVND